MSRVLLRGENCTEPLSNAPRLTLSPTIRHALTRPTPPNASIPASPSRTLMANRRRTFEIIDDKPCLGNRGGITRDYDILLSGNGVIRQKSHVETSSEQARPRKVTADQGKERWSISDDIENITKDGGDPGCTQ